MKIKLHKEIQIDCKDCLKKDKCNTKEIKESYEKSGWKTYCRHCYNKE